MRREPRSEQAHVNATCSFREPEVPSIEKVPDEHLAEPAPETRIRWPTNEGSARFHRRSKRRLDLSSNRSSQLLQGRMRSCDFCRECFNEHDQEPPEHPRRTESVMLGRLPSSSHRYRWIEGDNHRGYAGSGAEDHRTSTFPSKIAPGRDFAPTSLASDSSCREDHSPAPSGAT